MKTYSIKILIISFVLFLTSTCLLFAQPHPNNGNPPGGGDPPLGGGAPIGDGIIMFVLLATGYAIKKYKDYYLEQSEDSIGS